MTKHNVFQNYNDVEFSYMMTITSSGMGQYNLPSFSGHPEAKMDEFVRLVKFFLRRLARKVYGKATFKEHWIRLVGCFENRHKSGAATCSPHLHALVAVEPQFLERFDRHCKKEWKKTVLCFRKETQGFAMHPSFCSADLHLQPVEAFEDAEKYCAKHILYNDFAPLDSMNDKHQISL